MQSICVMEWQEGQEYGKALGGRGRWRLIRVSVAARGPQTEKQYRKDCLDSRCNYDGLRDRILEISMGDHYGFVYC